MRRRSPGLSGPMHEPVNVTPMIDVVMCLIIFFLIVGKLSTDERARVMLPDSAVGRTGETQSSVIVTIAPDPRGLNWGGVKATITVDGKAVGDAGELADALKQSTVDRLRAAGKDPSEFSKAGVIVRADKLLPYEAVEPALSACAALGIVRVDYATERVEGPGGGGTSGGAR
jgi:biopolymer transport protein ExbD